MSECICKNCLHKNVCRDTVYYEAIGDCRNFLGWVHFDEKPPIYKDILVLTNREYPIIGYYDNIHNMERFVDANIFKTVQILPNVWLKGLSLNRSETKMEDTK